MIRLVTAFAALALLATPTLAQQRVDYEIAFPRAAQHEARVTVTVRGIPAGSPLSMRMSRASPGRYAITQFAKNVYDVEATDGSGRKLSIARPDPHGWQVDGHDGTVVFSYTVWGDRGDGTYLQIDGTHARLNMPATFAWARGFEAVPIRLAIRPNPGWSVATQLQRTSDSLVFTAPNLQWFLDSPTEVGPLQWRQWQTGEGDQASTWRLAMHHQGTPAQLDSFAVMARRITQEQLAFWGEAPGLDHGEYTFIADYLPWVTPDAMEHRNSTFLSSRSPIATRSGRVNNLSALSHELFHAWSGERLRPRGLEPFDFERENLTGDLWFAEGFTSYFDDLFLRRAGYLSDEEYLDIVGGAIVSTIESPARRHGSPVDMSRMASFFDGGVYLDPTNRQNTFLSYYTWGAAIGAALDLTLRAERGIPIERFMRAMWSDFGRHQSASFAPERPYSLDDLRATLAAVTDTAFANGFFRRYVEGREVADYAALLGHAGVLLVASEGPFLGGTLAADSAGVRVNATLETGSLQPAGIMNGDVIHAAAGVAVATPAELEAVVARHAVGEVVQFDVTRRTGREMVPVTLVGPARYTVRSDERMTPQQRAFREAWFGSLVR